MKKKLNLPQYERPKITTYTSEDILEVIGPVQAATGYLTLEGWRAEPGESTENADKLNT